MVRTSLVSSLVLVVGCQAGTASWQSPGVSGKAEALLGQRAAPLLESRFGGTVTHLALLSRMQDIERRLTAANPDLVGPWRFRILDSEEISAFSLPGGLVYITRGLWERRIGDDNDLLAAVIAHEMAHVMRKDSLHAGGRAPKDVLQREISVDHSAARYLSAAGYGDACLRDLILLIKDVQPPGWAEARSEAQGGNSGARKRSRL